jgi:hypothetical protein
MRTVSVGPTHPLWKSFDDDDWGGATCGQWITALQGMDVRLIPPTDCSQELFERIREAITAVAKSVEVYKIRG